MSSCGSKGGLLNAFASFTMNPGVVSSRRARLGSTLHQCRCDASISIEEMLPACFAIMLAWGCVWRAASIRSHAVGAVGEYVDLFSREGNRGTRADVGLGEFGYEVNVALDRGRRGWRYNYPSIPSSFHKASQTSGNPCSHPAVVRRRGARPAVGIVFGPYGRPWQPLRIVQRLLSMGAFERG